MTDLRPLRLTIVGSSTRQVCSNCSSCSTITLNFDSDKCCLINGQDCGDGSWNVLQGSKEIVVLERRNRVQDNRGWACCHSVLAKGLLQCCCRVARACIAELAHKSMRQRDAALHITSSKCQVDATVMNSRVQLLQPCQNKFRLLLPYAVSDKVLDCVSIPESCLVPLYIFHNIHAYI